MAHPRSTRGTSPSSPKQAVPSRRASDRAEKAPEYVADTLTQRSSAPSPLGWFRRGDEGDGYLREPFGRSGFDEGPAVRVASGQAALSRLEEGIVRAHVLARTLSEVAIRLTGGSGEGLDHPALKRAEPGELPVFERIGADADELHYALGVAEAALQQIQRDLP